MSLVSTATAESGLLPGRHSASWVGRLALATEFIAAGAASSSVPFVAAVFDTALVFLRAVERVQRNRDMLHDLCISILEILSIIRDNAQSETNGSALQEHAHFRRFCDELTRLLNALTTEVGRGSRAWGRFKEFMNSGNHAEELRRLNSRVNDLRANLTLLMSLDITRKVTAQNKNQIPSFREIPIGDLNLIHEISLPSTAQSPPIRIFKTRVVGQSTTMTALQYAEDELWQRDLQYYENHRHPYLCQLFGVSHGRAWQGMIFHDELVPLVIYRQYHRPESDLVWSITEGMLFYQFKDAAPYHFWKKDSHANEVVSSLYHSKLSGAQLNTLEAAIMIRVNCEPPRLCMAAPEANEEYSTLSPTQQTLASWHSSRYEVYRELAYGPASQIPPAGKCLDSLGWSSLCELLLPTWTLTSTDISLLPKCQMGMVISASYIDPFATCILSSSACPANRPASNPRLTGWKSTSSELQMRKLPNRWTRVTFPTGSFRSASSDTYETSAQFVRRLRVPKINCREENLQWLLANGRTTALSCENEDVSCGIVQEIWIVVHRDWTRRAENLHLTGIDEPIYLFLPPVTVTEPQPSPSLVGYGLKLAEQKSYYWCSDPAGFNSLDEEAVTTMGIPPMDLMVVLGASVWQGYQFNAMRSFL
ncbi:hypothetical protein MKEN_00201900 [Mycena kentingensis (nom. inval.)]|nr:hypothetical protein MKEN_00201900 [Mycena kentingensis (nom. inval.)]